MLCSRIGLTETSNMLHYFNASSREKEWAIYGDQGGGLAWLLWQEGSVVDVVDHRGTSSGPRAFRKEVTEGGHNK